MTGLAARLRRLEQAARPAPELSLEVLWPEQFRPCLEHSHCGVEIENGTHHQGVIRLSFQEPST